MLQIALLPFINELNVNLKNHEKFTNKKMDNVIKFKRSSQSFAMDQ